MNKAVSSKVGSTPWTGDLSSIGVADWNYDRAGHLLERAGFGGTPAEIRRLAALSPSEAVSCLVYYQQSRDPEIPAFKPTGFYPPNWNRRDNIRAFAALQNIRIPGLSSGGFDAIPPTQRNWMMDDARTGVTPEMKRTAKTDKQSVVDAFFFYTFMDRRESERLQSWLADRALKTNRPLQEKLALFWHAHFATGNEKVKDYRKMIGQFEMFLRLGNMNFRDLLVGIAKDPAMLVYLDNNQNIKGHPNENFAREIMELFSLGVGNYTETDIKEAARAFTGWGLNADGTAFENHLNLHDQGVKTFLGHTGNLSGEEVIEIILEQPACSKFLSLKMYSFFVREDISTKFHDELAARLRANKLRIAPFLEELFLSKDFYSPASCGTQIKSPTQLVISTYKKLGLKNAPTCPEFAHSLSTLGQQIFFPPSVKGWDGGKAWINPATIFHRANFIRYLLFPEEAPIRKDPFLEGGRRLFGDEVYNFFLHCAAQNNFRDFPPREACSSSVGSSHHKEIETGRTTTIVSEDYNLFRGVFTAAYKSRAAIPPEPRKVAEFNLSAMLKSEGVTDSCGAVDSLLLRFMRITVTNAQRFELIRFFESLIGGSRIRYSRYTIELELRELLHLILSTPEYQLS